MTTITHDTSVAQPTVSPVLQEWLDAASHAAIEDTGPGADRGEHWIDYVVNGYVLRLWIKAELYDGRLEGTPVHCVEIQEIDQPLHAETVLQVWYPRGQLKSRASRLVWDAIQNQPHLVSTMERI